MPLPVILQTNILNSWKGGRNILINKVVFRQAANIVKGAAGLDIGQVVEVGEGDLEGEGSKGKGRWRNSCITIKFSLQYIHMGQFPQDG